MRTGQTKKQYLYDMPWGRALLALTFTTICILLTYALYRVTFLNNDDTNIFYALAGYRSGAPYPAHRFINVLLSMGISALYRALPAVPWWGLYQLCMLALSLTILNACLLKLCRRNGVPLWTACTLLIVLYAGVFVYTVAWMTFTLTAAMLGTAATALLLSLDAGVDARGAIYRNVIGAMLLLLLCFLTRNSSGYCMLCFVGAAALYQFLRNGRAARKRMVAASAVAAALVAIAVAVNSFGISYFNPPEYHDFETARGHFIDYPHATYEDDPAFYEAMGWDASVYALADNLCFLDPVVNAETMEAAAAHRTDVTRTLPQKLLDTLAFGVQYFRGSGASEYMLVIVVLLFIYGLLSYGRGKGGRLALRLSVLTAAGASVLCLYLCYKGRFPVRTFMLIAVPTALAEAVYMVRIYGENERRFFRVDTWRAMCASNTFRRRRRLYVICASLAALGILWSLVKTQVALFSYDKSDKVTENAAVEQYVMAHKENIYLTDVTSVENIAAFTVYPAEKPVNLIDWGGTGMHSGWKNAQLAVNGIETLSADLFRRDNVYFITATDNDKLPLLLDYLKVHCGCTGYTEAGDIIGTLKAYQFTFSEEVRP